MATQTIFKRHELKFVITTKQKEIIINSISPYMELDKYKRTTIKNIYFDTLDYRLIRRSIEKPEYKEKLRIRTYSNEISNNEVFIELKKKYDHVVYKRRMLSEEQLAIKWLTGYIPNPYTTQISKEIDYFSKFYKDLKPLAFLSYERESFYEKDGGDLRITFDENIIFRDEDITLSKPVYGTPILEKGKIIMEVKCSKGLPLWLVDVLSSEHIYKTSFSKYGTAYTNIIYPKLKENTLNEEKEIILNA